MFEPITFPHSASQVFFRYQPPHGTVIAGARRVLEEEYRDRELSKTPLLLGILKLEEAANQGKIKLIVQELGNTTTSLE